MRFQNRSARNINRVLPACDPLERRLVMSAPPTGVLLVTDSDSLGGRGAIYSIATDGTKTVLASKAPFVDPKGITEDIAGNIYVADSNGGLKRRGAIFKIDANTGAVSIVSQDITGLGNLFVDPTGLTFGPDGQLYVADPNAGKQQRGMIIKVDPATGVQSAFSQNGPDFGNNFVDPTGLAFDHHGNIIIADPNAGGGNGEIIQVDGTSGLQNVISRDGTGLGGHLHNPMGVSIQSNSVILIIDATTGTKNRGALVQIDPASGVQTELSFGGKFFHPNGLAIGPDNSIYVTQPNGFNGRGGVIKVTSRGSQGKAATGSPILHPFGVIVARNLSVSASKAADQTAIAGTPFSVSVGKYFSEADGTRSLTYSATLSDGSPLPSFLSISPSGVVSGTPSAAGVYGIIVTGTDPALQSANTGFALTITGPQLATIQVPPPLVITENGSGTFNFVASTTDPFSLINQVALNGIPAGWTIDLTSLNSNAAVVSSSFADGTLTVVVHRTASLSIPVALTAPTHDQYPFTLGLAVNTVRDNGTATSNAATTVVVDAVAATPAVGLTVGTGSNFVVPITVAANFTYPLDYSETDTVVVTLPATVGLVSTPAGGVFNASNQTITFNQPLGASTLNSTFDVVLPTSVFPTTGISAMATVVKTNIFVLDSNTTDKTAAALATNNIVDNEAATVINSGIGHDDPAIADITSALNAAKLKLTAMGATAPNSASVLAIIQSIENLLSDASTSTAQQIPTLSGMIGGGASSVIARLGALAAKIDGNSLLGTNANVVIQPPVLGNVQVFNLGSSLGGLVFNQLTYPGRPIGFEDQTDGTYVGPATVSGNTVVFAIHGVNFVSPALVSPIATGQSFIFHAVNGDVLTLTNDGNAINSNFPAALADKINSAVTSATYIAMDSNSVNYNGNTVISFNSGPGGLNGSDVAITDIGGEIFSSSGLSYPIAPATPITFTSTTRAGVTITITTGSSPVPSSNQFQFDLNLLFGFAGAQLAPALDARLGAILQSLGGTSSGNLAQQLDQVMATLQSTANPGNIFTPSAFAAVDQATDISDRLNAFLALFSTGNFVNPISNTITVTLGATSPVNFEALLQEMTDANAITAAPASVTAQSLASLSDIATVVDTGIGHDDPTITVLTDALSAAKSKLIALGSSDALSSSLLAFIQSIDNALAAPGLGIAQQIPTLMNMLSDTSSSSVLQPLRASSTMIDGSALMNSDRGIIVQPANLGALQVTNLGAGLGGLTINQLTYPGQPIGFSDDSNGNYIYPASIGGNGDVVNVSLNGETFSSPTLSGPIAAGGSVVFTASSGDSFTVTNDSTPITINLAPTLAGKINENITSATYISLAPSSITYDGGRTLSFGANPASNSAGTITLTSSASTFTASGLAYPIAAGATVTFTSASDSSVHLAIQDGTTPITSDADLTNRLNLMFANGSQVAPSIDSKINASLQELTGNTSGNLQGDVSSLATQLQTLTNPNNLFDPTAFAAINQATSLQGKLNAFLALFNTTNCPAGTITITMGITPPTTLQGLLDLMH